jgi:signal transduction histidine kinase
LDALKKKRLFKLRNQLGIISFGAAVLVSLSLSLVILRLQSSHLREELKHMGITIAKNLAMSSREFLLNNDSWNLYTLCRSIVEEDTTTVEAEGRHVNAVEYAMVADKNGVLAAHSNPLTNRVGYPFPSGDSLSSASLLSDGLLVQKTFFEGHPLYDISLPVRIMGRQKIGTVRIGISEKLLEELFASARRELLLASLAIALACGALFQWLARWITSSIETLGRFSEDISPHLPSAAPIPDINSRILEINALNDTLARMSQKIHNALQDIRMKKQYIQGEKEKLESILNGIGAGMVVLDKNLDMVWSNKVFAAWFDAPQSDGKHCYHCLKQKFPCVDCPATKTFATGEVCTLTQRRATREGEKYFRVITVPWRDERNEVGQIFELSLDISEKTELERRLKNSERVALIGELAATMAHEIRNPLSSLVSSIDLLHKGGQRLSQEDQNSLMEVVTKESQRLSRILEDFLKYGRKAKMKMEWCDPGQILDEIITMANHGQDASGHLEFIREKDGRIPLIKADEEMLKQAFWNLIVNSMEAIRGGGKIHIKFKNNGNHLQILLSDTGCGVPVQIIDHIFEPFHTAKEGGTGLGLAIASKMIAMHSGHLELVETSGKGTTFSISLPLPPKTGFANG